MVSKLHRLITNNKYYDGKKKQLQKKKIQKQEKTLTSIYSNTEAPY